MVVTSDRIISLTSTNQVPSCHQPFLIFLSLTTFFSGGGHHSPLHSTISPQPTITITKQNNNALKK
ncbi:hypothetical protein Hanom_Chr12g01150091 [Helianthus anomalus]